MIKGLTLNITNKNNDSFLLLNYRFTTFIIKYLNQT